MIFIGEISYSSLKSIIIITLIRNLCVKFFSVARKGMSTFMANVSVRKQYFLVGNVQAIKLIANRRIYGCDFRAMVHVWYAFPVTEYSWQIDKRAHVEGKKEKDKTKSTKGRRFFTELVLSRSGKFRTTFYGKRKAFLDYNCGNDVHRESDL